MKAIIAGMLLAASGAPALAQHAGHEGHVGHDMPAQTNEADPHAGHGVPSPGDIGPGPPPPAALSGPEHAADSLFPPGDVAAARRAGLHEMGGMSHAMVLVDRLEWQAGKAEGALVWDANAWSGGDIDKLWLKSEGEISGSGNLEDAEVQALWSHAISPYFDFQAGVRQDLRHGPDRTHLAFGVQGLAPYFFEIDAAAFVSNKGDLTARIEGEYDQRITQRLIAQPRVGLELAAQDVPELGIGAGLSSLHAGIRLRYEIVREFAPYAGVEWQRDFGGTARSTRAGGGDADRAVAVFGVRAWF